LANDPYQELGVARGASQDEMRKAYRKLAKQYHPDANPGDKASEEKFKRVTAAFDLLGDVQKRAKFDRGEMDADGRDIHPGFNAGGGFGSSGFGAGGPFGSGARGPTMGPDIDLSDIFGEAFGVGGRGRGFQGFGGPQRGQDVRARLDIDLEDAILGARKRISFPEGRSLEVNIPAGAADGQVMRLKGQGAPGRPGRDGAAGPAGDALIELSIRPHPVFRREGDTLVMDLPVSVPDAVLGGKVEARTPEGPVTLTLPPGSNSGATLRLKGRGLAQAGGKRGDLLAKLVISLPETPDPELVKFAEKWRKDRPYTPRRR
jgi:DnaJ-class molecular chaperone